MIKHQQQMKAVLDVVESFDRYEMINDAPNMPNCTPIEDIGSAFDEHRAALKELTSAIAQHEQARQQMMTKCKLQIDWRIKHFQTTNECKGE